MNIHWKNWCWSWKLQWFSHLKNWVIGKDRDAGKDWRQEKGRIRGSDGWMATPTWWTWVWGSSGCWWWTGNLAFFSPWGQKELDMTKQLNCTVMWDLNKKFKAFLLLKKFNSSMEISKKKFCGSNQFIWEFYKMFEDYINSI